MSFWFLKRANDKGWNWVGLDLLPLPFIWAVFAIFLNVVILEIRSSPVVSVWTFLLPMLAGFILFLIAKISMMRRASILSFGSAAMTPRMRALYHAGYALMVLAAVMIVGYWAIVMKL
jgi:hypothetical protein